MANGHVLNVSDIRKRFGELEAVKGVSFHIEPGETYGLLGPNGAGKTTSISMIAGLLERDGGQVVVDGRPMETTTTDTKAVVGLVPQDLAIYPDLTAEENLTFFGKLYGMGGKDLARRVDEVLGVIGLEDRRDDRSKEYSGGMKRRLNIGIGLLHNPKLLILDEPTVGVDPQSRNAILSSVEHLSEEGIAVLYTTHYMEEAERLCDRVGIIDHGELKAEGTRRELVALVGEKDRLRLAGTGSLSEAAKAASGMSGIEQASATDGGVDIVAANVGQTLPEILATVAAAGMQVSGVEITEPDLEAVFLHLTGRALRD